jgi:hypothetical protein
MKLREKCITAAEAAEKGATELHGLARMEGNQPEPSQQNTERRASIL